MVISLWSVHLNRVSLIRRSLQIQAFEPDKGRPVLKVLMNGTWVSRIARLRSWIAQPAWLPYLTGLSTRERSISPRQSEQYKDASRRTICNRTLFLSSASHQLRLLQNYKFTFMLMFMFG